ncbi:hypothetical protein ACS5PJ_08495 [Pseudarthrobacter sp. YS3]|uniref:hypothetical protein n=1 Tax=Pseudarthrobacter sp. YS3 TaxID=3453718 RepID=UPI003EED5C3D
MHPVHRARTFAALATLAALTLTGCMAHVSSEAAGTPAAGATAPASVSATPVPSNTASPTTAGERPTSSAPASSAPAPAGLATYTFPDGRLSFKYPAGWRVELFEASSSPFVGTATIYDAGGQRQAEIFTGVIADGVSSPVIRTVFESLPVPGLQGQPEPDGHYSFYVDNVNDVATYRMHLTPGTPVAGAEMGLPGLIRIGERVLIAEVTFIDNPFANDEDAKAWLAGAEGQALKALLMSMSYS